MQSRLWLTLAVFFAILLWAGFRIATTHPTPDEPPVIPVARPRPAPPRQDDRPSIAAADFRFADAALRSEFLRYDEAVTRMPDLGWTETAGELYVPERGNPIWEKVWQRPGRVVSIRTVVREPSRECDRFEFRAAVSHRERWGASLHYIKPGTGLPEWYIGINPPKQAAGEIRLIHVTPGHSSYSTSFELSGRQYEVSVGRSARKSGMSRAEITPYFESAEALRDSARREILQLRVEREAALASGKGIVEWTTAPPTQGGRVALRDQAVGDEVRQEALKRFQSAMDERLEWIDTHSAEMHAALLEVFPGVRELLFP